jgi:hypothetical protein
MTISTNDQAVDQEKFNDNFEQIFGASKPIKRGSYVQDPTTGKMVLRGTLEPKARVNAPMVHNGLKEFVSPIDKSVISTRKQLAEHNKKHGVTNSSDYSNGYIEGRARKRIDEGQAYLKKTRREEVTAAVDRILQ